MLVHQHFSLGKRNITESLILLPHQLCPSTWVPVPDDNLPCLWWAVNSVQKKREEAIHAVPSSVLLGLLPCCFTLHSARHQSTLFSESQLSHGSGSPSSPTSFLWCGFIPTDHSLSSLWASPSRALVVFQKVFWGFLVHSQPHFTAQPVLGCLYPHISLPVACGVIQLRSG